MFKIGKLGISLHDRNSPDISEFEIEVLFRDRKISVFSIRRTWFAQFGENEERQSLVDPTIDPIHGVTCRKLHDKLDGLSDRNEREGFRGDLVNQADTKRQGKETGDQISRFHRRIRRYR